MQLTVDNLLSSVANKGQVDLTMMQNATATVVSAIGYLTARRLPDAWTVPTLTGVNGLFMTACHVSTVTNGGPVVAGLEYIMSTLTVSGNSNAAGVSMPTKTIAGSSVTTATLIPMLRVKATLTATTPTVTVTYVNQDGTGSRTATIGPLPTSPAINTCYLITPYLQSGDTGIRSGTLSIDTGSAGSIELIGILPMHLDAIGTINHYSPVEPLRTNLPRFLATAGESIAFYQFSGAAFVAGVNLVTATLVGDVT